MVLAIFCIKRAFEKIETKVIVSDNLHEIENSSHVVLQSWSVR